MIESEIPFGAEGVLDDLDDPVQHFVEAKQFEEQLWLVAVLCLGKSKMNRLQPLDRVRLRSLG